jgi:hypothetical protein
MSNNRVVTGEVKALKNGNLYVESGKRTYEIPVTAIRKIWDDDDSLTLQDIALHNSSYVVPSIVAKVHCGTNGNYDSMSDREFEVFLVNKQLAGAKHISKTMWSIWGVSVGIGLVTVLIVAN